MTSLRQILTWTTQFAYFRQNLQIFQHIFTQEQHREMSNIPFWSLLSVPLTHETFEGIKAVNYIIKCITMMVPPLRLENLPCGPTTVFHTTCIRFIGTSHSLFYVLHWCIIIQSHKNSNLYSFLAGIFIIFLYKTQVFSS